MKWKKALLGTTAIVATLLSITAIPSYAAMDPAVKLSHSVTTTTVVPSCMTTLLNAAPQVVTADDAREQCTVTSTLTIGQETLVSVAMIMADKTLSAVDRSSLLNAAAVTAISSKNYSQFTTGGFYTVTQNGKFYYNGSRVWVGTPYSGYQGSHHCFVNYAYPVSITDISCSESGSTAQRSMYMGWTVNAGFSYGVSMTAVLYKNGTASGFGVTLS